jgi:hypothetical protein
VHLNLGRVTATGLLHPKQDLNEKREGKRGRSRNRFSRSAALSSSPLEQIDLRAHSDETEKAVETVVRREDAERLRVSPSRR